MTGAISVSLIAIAIVLGSTVVIARPSEAVVLSGRERRRGGRTFGYRLVRGGRAVRLPLLESAARLDLGAFRVPISLRGVRSSDRAIDAELVVHARLLPEEPGIDQAVSRMLGVDPDQRRELCATLLDPLLRDAIEQFEADELERGDLGVIADRLTGYSAPRLSESGIDVMAVHVLEWRGAGA
jgi:flotillin